MNELEKQVIAAVHTLHADYNDSRRRDADRWLIEFQTTPEAWMVSFSLLHSDNLQNRYFGIQTLYFKISKQWSSLETSQKKELVARLLPLLSDFANDPVVLSKICDTLCQIILQSLSDIWNNPIDDLIHRFSTNLACQSAILQVFAYLAEGILELNVPDVKKKEVEEYLKNYSGKIFDLVLQILQKKENEKLCVKALQCLNSWFIFYLPVGQIITSPFVPLLFDYLVLRDSGLVGGAAEILKEIFSADISKYNASKQVVLFAMNRLCAICRESLHEINFSHVCSLCITVSNPIIMIKEAGDAGLLFFSCLLSFCTLRENDFGLLSDLLSCFHDIQDALRNNEECNDDDKIRFKPLFIKLVEQIIRLFVYPPNYEEFQAEYVELRSQLSINLLFVYYLYPDCLAVLKQALDASLGSPNWTYIEACLSCFLAIADGVSEDENVYIPHLFRSLEKITWNHTLLIKTAIKLVGRYTIWLSNNERNLTLKLVNFIVPFLADPNLCPYSAESLLSLSEMKSDYLLDIIGPMLPQCEATMKTMKVENKSLVLSALCNIVVRLENPNDCCTIVGGLASQTISDLRALLQPSQDGDQMNALVENIECLCSIVKSADTENQPHPLTKVVADSWEILILLFNKFCSTPGQESRATEPMCSLFSHFILSLKTQFVQYLQSLEKALYEAYVKNYSPSILNTFNIIAVVFDSEEFNPYIRVTLDVIITTINSLPSNLDLMPDTIASLFKLASQLIQRKKSGLIAETAFISPLLGFTLRVCIDVKERNAARSAFKFLSTFLSLDSQDVIEHVKNYVTTFIKDFVAVVMKNLSANSSETVQKGSGELLYQILTLSHPALVKGCINEYLKALGKENNEALQALLSQIIREKNKQNFRKFTSQFASLLSV